MHRRYQPDYVTEVIEIDGLSHTVVPNESPPDAFREYLEALFAPFAEA